MSFSPAAAGQHRVIVLPVETNPLDVSTRPVFECFDELSWKDRFIDALDHGIIGIGALRRSQYLERHEDRDNRRPCVWGCGISRGAPPLFRHVALRSRTPGTMQVFEVANTNLWKTLYRGSGFTTDPEHKFPRDGVPFFMGIHFEVDLECMMLSCTICDTPDRDPDLFPIGTVKEHCQGIGHRTAAFLELYGSPLRGARRPDDEIQEFCETQVPEGQSRAMCYADTAWIRMTPIINEWVRDVLGADDSDISPRAGKTEAFEAVTRASKGLATRRVESLRDRQRAIRMHLNFITRGISDLQPLLAAVPTEEVASVQLDRDIYFRLVDRLTVWTTNCVSLPAPLLNVRGGSPGCVGFLDLRPELLPVSPPTPESPGDVRPPTQTRAHMELTSPPESPLSPVFDDDAPEEYKSHNDSYHSHMFYHASSTSGR